MSVWTQIADRLNSLHAANVALAEDLADNADATALEGKADLVGGKLPTGQLPTHSHGVSQVTGLSEALGGKVGTTTGVKLEVVDALPASDPAKAGTLYVVRP